MGSSDRILSAAENVFARFGYRRASMSQIAGEAGLTRQALYHHYPSKEALFRAVVEQLQECAYEAEAAAGLDQEGAGGGLADILAAQIGARFRCRPKSYCRSISFKPAISIRVSSSITPTCAPKPSIVCAQSRIWPCRTA
jgi:AcrR family transcriptional regulator